MNYFIMLILSFSLFSPNVSSQSANHKLPSLRDKIGQMLILGFSGKRINNSSEIVHFIQEDNIGGVILFDYDYQKKTFDKNIESPEQVKQLNNDLKEFAEVGNKLHSRPNLPLLISVDYEGGKISRIGPDYGFPATLSAAEIGEKSLEEANYQAKNMADTLKDSGFNLDFAPVLDVNLNPENPVIAKKQRSFSADASQVGPYARAYSKHFLKQEIQCAYKHFPGHGSSTGDSHLGFVDVSNSWQDIELEPYKYSFDHPSTACGMVMIAHVINRQLDPSGLPATLSEKMTTELLRQNLHFKGVIISDDMQMRAITDNYKLDEALVLSINAGVEMFIFGNNLTTAAQDPKEIIDIIEARVKSGQISEEKIERAYQHIIALKQGLS